MILRVLWRRVGSGVSFAAQLQMYNDDIKDYLLLAASYYFWISLSEKPYTLCMLYCVKMKLDKPVR
jgi:hypothetical protein